MKFNVGDKVRIVGNKPGYFDIGTIVEIVEIPAKGEYICCRTDEHKNKVRCWVYEEDISSIDYTCDYTWEDFLKAPIGTKVTFENGYVLVKYYDGGFTNFIKCRRYDSLEGFKDVCGCGCLGKIIKIEEPTYTTVYDIKEEVKEMTIAEIEKELGYKIKVVKEKNNEI